MTEHGIPLCEVRVVPDIEAKIIEAVNALRAEYDYVFTTGGIGPTHDDITASCVAKAFGLPFGRHEGAYQELLKYYGSAEEVTESRARMADMPEGAELIMNAVSGAPGFRLENVYVMAGVPRIMQSMLGEVLKAIGVGEKILSNTVICDLVESMVAEGLGKIQDAHPNIDIGSYPYARGGRLGVTIVLRSTDEAAMRLATPEVLALIREKGGEPLGMGLQVALDQEDF
jgi:molybdopterin-biosynthesis enzyme MoeA-like protein